MKLNPAYHQDPQSLHVGTLPQRAHFLPFATAEEALTTPLWQPERSSRVTMLSGCNWQFGYYASPEEVPEGFFAPGFDASALGSIPVPGCWQMFGHGGHQYTNTRYPFPFDPPYLPEENPAGAYRHSFTLTPQECTGGMMLHLEGVDSCFYAWLNGEFLGYSQVSHATAEFDVAGKVKPGENLLALLVLKWCDGSYLEDQDKLRMSGIFRDVYLLHRPEAHVVDYFATADFADDFSRADIQVSCRWAGGQPTAALALLAPDGTELDRQPLAETIHFTVDKPRLWNAETPTQYTLLFEGEEYIAQDLGLRRVEVKNGVLYLNGQNIKLKGVNRHDSDPLTGCVISPAQMEKDLAMMKQANLNAIRTSHYPNAPWAAQMFSRWGFYAISESDMEAHGSIDLYGGAREEKDYYRLATPHPRFGMLAHSPAFHDAIVDRTVCNVERDKNAAGVIIWSLGNESGYGPAFEAAAAWAKTRDSRRLVHYESSIYDVPGRESDWSNLDVYSHMYAPPEAIDHLFENKMLTKPFVHCEYAHAMGNGPGDLEAYFQRMYKYDGYAGGFVWEWCDHSVFQGYAPDGRKKFYYGGDFGEFPHDGDFCLDGLVYPDRTPHTGLYELKNVARPARVIAEDAASRTVTVYNTLDFTRLDEAVTGTWVLLVDGEEAKSGVIPAEQLAIPPHGKGALTLPVALPTGQNASVLLWWHQKNDSLFVPAGTEVGFDQIWLHVVPAALPASAAQQPMLEQDDRRLTVTGENFRYQLDKRTGLFTHLVKDGVEYLTRPMEYNIWRAPTSNDRVIRQEWEAAGYNRAFPRVYSVQASGNAQEVTIKVCASLTATYLQRLALLETVWTVTADGRLRLCVEATRSEELPYLPRFGLRLFLPEAFTAVEYMGYGPGESYADKHRAGWYGRFSSSVNALWEDYIRPQENGARYGCTWARLASGNNSFTAAGENFSFTAAAYTQEEMTCKQHNYELEKTDATVLCLDYKQSGLGSNSCGPVLAEEYRLEEKQFTWKLELAFGKED